MRNISNSSYCDPTLLSNTQPCVYICPPYKQRLIQIIGGDGNSCFSGDKPRADRKEELAAFSSDQIGTGTKRGPPPQNVVQRNLLRPEEKARRGRVHVGYDEHPLAAGNVPGTCLLLTGRLNSLRVACQHLELLLDLGPNL